MLLHDHVVHRDARRHLLSQLDQLESFRPFLDYPHPDNPDLPSQEPSPLAPSGSELQRNAKFQFAMAAGVNSGVAGAPIDDYRTKCIHALVADYLCRGDETSLGAQVFNWNKYSLK